MVEDTMTTNGGRSNCAGADVTGLAEAIAAACGLGTALDLGSGEGCLTEALLRHGLDARGLDLNGALVADANTRMPGRFIEGDVRATPFADGQFDVVVSDGCLEWLDDAGVRAALAEVRRVCSRYVILRLDVSKKAQDGALRSRAWWERQCFSSGFRKHPRYYRLSSYESLNHEGSHILIALERLSDEALAAYPLSALEEERGLHMDMLRDTGERSDAHVIRYQWACDFIRPHDRVLDAACGLGYGGHVVRSLTRASSVTGIDGSEYAVDYANLCYGSGHDRGRYVCGYLPQALGSYPDGSFDAVISFETLEHVEDPQALLKEFHRVLTPGGRVIVSVPNDWSDESGEDPNPYHLQVYDLDRLRAEIASDFDVEAACAQSASQAKVIGQRLVWERKQRELYPVDPHTREPMSAEWWLMVGIKSPFSQAEYQERVFENVAPSGHPSVRYAEEYANPWLGLAMITIGQRASLPALRGDYATTVIEQGPHALADYGAALCVKAYVLLESRLPASTQVDALIEQINRYLDNHAEGATILRWQVSLAYVKAAILRAQGRFEDALHAFVACAGIDAGSFGVHLLTKTTAAWFEAGKLALGLGRRQQALELWTHGLEVGRRLLSVRLEDILLLPSYPNLFNHGDGIREYALAWDNLARCANGVHLLASGDEIDVHALDASFAAEYETVTRDLLSTRDQLRGRDTALGALRGELYGRTQQLEQAAADILRRDSDLTDTRALLIERTRLLEASAAREQELAARVEALQAELGNLRALLVERTDALNVASRELIDRTQRLELDEVELVELRRALDASHETLDERARELNRVAAELEDRVKRL
jgi:SAM-dependent methyltransferase